jgi:hypothetical protein
MRAWARTSGFDRGRVLLGILIVAVGVAHVVWPNRIQLDTPSLVLIGLLFVLLALPLLEELTLPGNVSARFRRELAEVDGATLGLLKTGAASIPGESDAAVGERVSPTLRADLPQYLDALATVAPAAASAAIRTEVEHRLRVAYELTVGVSAPESTAEVVRQLLEHGSIDSHQAELVYRILALATTGAQAANTGAADVRRLVSAARRVSDSLSTSAEDRFGRFLKEVTAQLEGARTVRNIRAFDGSRGPDFVVETDRGVVIVKAKLIGEGVTEVNRRIREARLQLGQVPLDESRGAVIVVPDYAIPENLERASPPVVKVSELARWIDRDN